jgi:DNA-binding CsgD family transcriptional regulator/PAS domain-containing protein
MERFLFQSINDWRNIFDNITDMITIHDTEFNILHANNTAKRILKLPDLESNSIKCYGYFHGIDSPPEGCPSCKCLRTGESAIFEVYEPHLKMFLEIRSMPRFDSKGKLIGLIHIARDITKSKRMEEKIINDKNQLERIVKERTAELTRVNKELLAEINERKMIEENLRFTEKELSNHVKELKESNIALKVLLKQRENDQREFENNILSNLKHLVMPYLTKLKRKHVNDNDRVYLNLIESNLNEIVSPFSSRLSINQFNLTPREIQIADLVKDGKQNKEIMEVLCLSIETVKTHRKNIRKKLRIYSKRINLRTYLLTLSNNR